MGLWQFCVVHFIVLSTCCLLYTQHLTALCPGLPGWAGTRKVKPIWILLKQETVSGSGISWAICKSAPSFRQITMPAPHHSIFYRPDALPAAQPTVSKHCLLYSRLFSIGICFPSSFDLKVHKKCFVDCSLITCCISIPCNINGSVMQTFFVDRCMMYTVSNLCIGLLP